MDETTEKDEMVMSSEILKPCLEDIALFINELEVIGNIHENPDLVKE